MWWDREVPPEDTNWPPDVHREMTARPWLRCDMGLWQELTAGLAAAGANAVLIDLGDGVRYDSHPEIGVDGAWTPDELRAELKRLRGMGLEPIPKLNFSAAHDTWLGDYSRMVSTPMYYRVCEDLIAEVCDIFEQPRLFHIGFDDESAEVQQHQLYTVVRQHFQWWVDLLRFARTVENCGSRAWMWSDNAWLIPEQYFRMMPNRVVQSNCWYGRQWDEQKGEVRTFVELDSYGYVQIPTGSNWVRQENFSTLARECRQRLRRPGGTLGFLQTSWVPTLPAFRDRHLRAIEALGEAVAEARADGDDADATAAGAERDAAGLGDGAGAADATPVNGAAAVLAKVKAKGKPKSKGKGKPKVDSKSELADG